jgi:protein-tyrosine kinase
MSLIERAIERLTHQVDGKDKDQASGPTEDVAYIIRGELSEGTKRDTRFVRDTPIDIDEEELSTALGANKIGSATGYKRTRQRASIDLNRLATLGYLTPDKPNQRIAEELRVIKRRLLLNAAGLGDRPLDQSNLIMVTSSMPEEGKTFTAINLAISIAMEMDRTVLLVDADSSRASATRTLAIDTELGWTDLLSRSDLDMADVLVKTNVDTLTVLPAGNTLSGISEYMASKKTAAIFNELARRYRDRIIIFDSPPLLATTEVDILASLVGQIVVVVEAERTRQSDLLTAVGRLDSRNKAVGLVLNKCNEPHETTYYEDYQKLRRLPGY